MSDEQTDAERMDIEEVLDFASSAVEDEADDFDGDVPDHSARLIVSRATDLLQTTTNIDMAQASDAQDDPSDESITGALEEDAVDILLALGALQFEYDLDIATAFEERAQLIEDYMEFEAAVEDVETEEAAMEAFDEHMAHHMDEDLDMGGVHAGMNVDSEDYDHDETDRSFA